MGYSRQIMQLDSIDLRILRELQEDGSLTNVELARRVHLSPSPCLARVKAMEAAGVISKYVALADPKAVGLGPVGVHQHQPEGAVARIAGRLRAPHRRARRGDGVLPDDRRQRLPDPRGHRRHPGAGALHPRAADADPRHREDPVVVRVEAGSLQDGAAVAGDVEWDSRIVADEPGRRIAWRSLAGADLPNEGELVFGPGRAGWGTEVRLTWRFDPPAGRLGDFVARLSHAPHAMGMLVLRRFKSLAETGEVPTLAHTPTTRDDPDPYGAFE
jgi:DNA-binding Lrp family transcriptional regulator